MTIRFEEQRQEQAAKRALEKKLGREVDVHELYSLGAYMELAEETPPAAESILPVTDAQADSAATPAHDNVPATTTAAAISPPDEPIGIAAKVVFAISVVAVIGVIGLVIAGVVYVIYLVLR